MTDIVLPSGRFLGRKPDTGPKHLDSRFMHAQRHEMAAPLPRSVDLSSWVLPALDQGELGCHDDRTEVLTETGWKPWPNYTGVEALATVNPSSGAMEFQYPTALHRYDYAGPLFGSDNRSLDFALTPNHRMFVRKWDERGRTLAPDFSFTEVSKIGWYAGLPVAPSGFTGAKLERIKIGDRSYDGSDFIKLVSLVISDGWVGRPDQIESNKNRISFCCFHPSRMDKVRELASRLDLHELPRRPGVWVWNDGALAEWFRANAYTGEVLSSPHKRIPQLIKYASGDQIGDFLHFFGDQLHEPRGGGRQFYSSSPEMIDDLQECLLRVGKRSSIYERAPRSSIMRDGREICGQAPDITLTERAGNKLSIDRKEHIYQGDYKGEVFCASVPNSLLITRRNGQTLISGNSCELNAAAKLLEFLYPGYVASRLQMYYDVRKIEGTIGEDSGCETRDVFQMLQTTGAITENRWPYDINTFTTEITRSRSKAKKIRSFSRLMNAGEVLACLASGYPLILGFEVPASFDSEQVAKTGIVPFPQQAGPIVGGHGVLVVGYDMDFKNSAVFKASGLDPMLMSDHAILILNSWGSGWGLGGAFWMSLIWAVDNSTGNDLWTARI